MLAKPQLLPLFHSIFAAPSSFLSLKDGTSWFISQTLATRHCYYGDPRLWPAPISVCCCSLFLFRHLPISLCFTTLGQKRPDNLCPSLSFSFYRQSAKPRLQWSITNQARSWMSSCVSPFHLPVALRIYTKQLIRLCHFFLLLGFVKGKSWISVSVPPEVPPNAGLLNGY